METSRQADHCVDPGTLAMGRHAFPTRHTIGDLGTHDLEVRTAERARIARELHDSTSQLLVVLELQLIRLKQLSEDAKVQPLLTEMGQVLDDLHQEIRDIACPSMPVLRHRTLRQALEAMSAQFAHRTGIKVDVKGLRDVLPVSPKRLETLYRIAQEALANAQRHAHAAHVRIRLSAKSGWIFVAVRDDGVGMPEVIGTKGTGLRHMEDRAREVGGLLSVRRMNVGSLIVAGVPAGEMAHIAA